MLIPIIQQEIHQLGCAPAYINDARCYADTRAANQLDSNVGAGLIPTDVVGGFGGVDVFPVGFAIHRNSQLIFSHR